MAKFREFYVQPGAGSNFLAGKCLWTDKADSREHLHLSRTSTNEFFFDREQINKVWHEIPFQAYHKTEVHKIYKEMFDSKYDSMKIKKTLIELDEIIKSISPNDGPSEQTYRGMAIHNIESMWENDCSYQCQAFREHIQPNMYSTGEIPELVAEKLREVEDYFINCREYYFSLCKNMNWNSFTISHIHPYNAFTSRLKLPENFKSLIMKFDETTNIIINALQHIKKEQTRPHNYQKKHHIDWIINIEMNEPYIEEYAKLTDDSVSYRKIFLENDENEVMKMYDFFENKDYFEENKTNIMKEFKEYHNNNMAVLKQYIDENQTPVSPNLYEIITNE